jgi:hypothetical protein
MSDKELLELAAKAAGHTISIKTLIESGWNPLTDDGDAFRLMVKLGLRVRTRDERAIVDIYQDGGWFMEIQIGTVDSGWNKDSEGATRKAIVHAAAEIGKEMT